MTLLLGLSGCLTDGELDARPGESEQELASNEGKFDVAIDAPWRIEPRQQLVPTPTGPGNECFSGDCVIRYPAIPIQLTVHDADAFVDAVPTATGTFSRLRLGDFVDVTVTERSGGVTNTTTFGITQLREIERLMDAWPNPLIAAAATFLPTQQVCKTWENRTCATSFRNIGSTNEWHATLMYRPKTQRPGADVELDVTMRVSRLDAAGQGPYRIIEHLRTHLAAAPLPRFGTGWAYGDLHYHSQGTDNDGESGYAFRGVIQAMAAMGLDFVVAADHASNSPQMTNLDTADIASWNLLQAEFGALRDMSPKRFTHLHDWLNSSGGANRQVLKVQRWQDWGLAAIPQIVLGGEVDAIPELTQSELADGIRYGNGRRYRWWNACTELPPLLLGLPTNWPCHEFSDYVGNGQWSLNMTKVRAGLVAEREPGRFLLRDPQAREVDYFARQHLIYLPRASNRTGFVSSTTSKWGGATRRLSEILQQDFEQRGLGFAFLAHPTAAASGSGYGRVGPDIVPYSDAQLATAFASRHILGLQLWNEDSKLEVPLDGDNRPSGVSAINWVNAARNGTVELDWWTGATWRWTRQTSPASGLQHGSAAWDKMLLWGIDPARTASLPWLASGQPRRVFMAGGSDAHGDLGMRREGAITGTDLISDTAIGKPRNLVFVGAPAGAEVAADGSRPRSWSQPQLADGFASGQFSITDGPAARIAIDVNRNGIIDAGDVPMGSSRQFAKGEKVPVVVEWMSTAEFGHVTGVDFYVGVHADALGKGMIYAPTDHGVHGNEVTDQNGDGNFDPQAWWAQTHVHGPSGRRFDRLKDHYWGDPTLRLGVSTHAYGQIVRRSLEIDPARFPVLSFDCNDAVDRMETPDRFFVRAFLRTAGRDPVAATCDLMREECIERWAFTNPVWVTTPAQPLTLFPTMTTATLPPAPPFEPENAVESVRIEREQGRTFDRGFNSVCFDGTAQVAPHDAWRSFWAISTRRDAQSWAPYAATGVLPTNSWLVDGGQAQHFNLPSSGVSIYFNPHVGPSASAAWGCAYQVMNGIRDTWWNSGSENGPFGYPVTDERYYGGGAYQYFDKGAMFWKSSLGVVALPAQLAAKHLELMRRGVDVFPTSSATVGSTGVTATLENGAQLFAKTSGVTAFVVDGAILDRYRALGGALSYLGYPIADAQIGAGGTRFQRFENGTLFSGFEMDAGVCEQSGGLRWPSPLPVRPGE